MEEVQNFFEEVSSNKPRKFDFSRLAYIAVSEWHWSQKDLLEADIPFVFSLLDERTKDIKRQEKEMKKARRK